MTGKVSSEEIIVVIVGKKTFLLCVFLQILLDYTAVHTSVTGRCCINAYQANYQARLRFHAGYANTPIGRRNVEMKPFWVCLYVIAWNSCSWGRSTFSNYYGLTVKSLSLEIRLEKKKKRRKMKKISYCTTIVSSMATVSSLNRWTKRTMGTMLPFCHGKLINAGMHVSNETANAGPRW